MTDFEIEFYKNSKWLKKYNGELFMTLNQFIAYVIEKRYSPTTIRVLLALLEQLECDYDFSTKVITVKN